MSDEINKMLSDFQPGELHQYLEQTGHDAASNLSKIDMAMELMRVGVPISDIPMDNMELLTKMFQEHKDTPSLSPEEELEFKKLFSPGLDKFSRFSNISKSLDNKGHADLADDIEKLSHIILAYELEKSELVPELDMDVSYLSNETPSLTNNIPSDKINNEDIDDQEIEDNIITPKDIDALLNKLESVMDVMGDDFDPDMIPIAKKILKEISDSFDKIDDNYKDEILPENDNIPTEQTLPIPETNSLPISVPKSTVASIVNSTIKIAKIADNLENKPTKQHLVNDINDIIYNIQKIITKI